MSELKQSMGFWTVAALSFLNLVNTGLFFGVQIGAAASLGGQHAGIVSLGAWAILALVSVYIAACFGELTSMFPSAGGVYEFAKQAYGRFPSFLVGWVVWVAGNIATALFTVAAVDYLLPNSAVTVGGIVFSAYAARVILSILLIVVLNYIAYRGADASARMMIVLSLFMLVTIALIIGAGLTSVQRDFLGFSYDGPLLLISLFFISETFFGWEAASYMSEETKDAARTIPRALILTTIVVALLALLLAVAIIGTLGTETLVTIAPSDVITLLLQRLHAAPQLILAVSIGIVIALVGNASGNIVTLPRLLLALSRDKLFPEQFSDIHPKHQTPHKAIIFQTIVAVCIVLFAAAAYERLLALLIPVSLALYASVLVLVPYFRRTRKDHPRPFKVLGGSWLPLLLGLSFLGLLVAWTVLEPGAVSQLRLLGSFILFSIPIYLLLTYFYDPDALMGTMSFFSRTNLWLENMLIPRSLRKEIIAFMTNARDKHVLEFGSGVGTLTVHLAEHVGRKGKVYAVDLSRANIDILRKRMNRLGHAHVEVIHDPHLVNRVHPSVHGVDIIVSINNLSYIQDMKKVLREMGQLLPAQGGICFVEYIDMFYVLPNPKWLSDPDEVKRVFRDAGFTVKVEVKRGLFWNYLYIYGIKDSRGGVYI